MSTVLARVQGGKEADVETTSLDSLDSNESIESTPLLGAPQQQEKRAWFKKSKAYDPDAIATQVWNPRYLLA